MGYVYKTFAVKGCPVWKFCGEGVSLDADIRTFWCKYLRFFEI